jgi:hypothetical protein
MGTGQGSDIYITISDFTRGIASSRHTLAGSQPTPEDTEAEAVFAQETGTWGCYGHPAGGLHPLPGVVRDIVDPGDDWPNDELPGAARPSGSPTWSAHPNYTSEKSLVVNATALIRVNPVLFGTPLAASWRNNTKQTPDQIHILYGGYGTAVGATATNYVQGTNEWRVWNMSYNPVETTTLMGGHLAVADLKDSLGVRLAALPNALNLQGFTDNDHWGDHFMSLGMTAANLVVATTGTYETDAVGVQKGGSITEIGATTVAALTTRVGFWPRVVGKNASYGRNYVLDNIETYVIDATNVIAPIPGSPMRNGVVHQNRIVFTLFSRNGEGAAQQMGQAGAITPGDNIGYFQANDLYTVPSTNMFRFMPENPGSIGVLASMNSNELIGIKHTGGGGLIRGDVAKPQFVALPGLPSIQGASNIPVVTPMGLIFGTRDGVYMWQGAEGAELLSQSLDGWFWQPEGTPDLEDGFLYEDYPNRGKFNYSSPYVYVPNNWVYDTRTGGWFRLSTTTHDVGEDTYRTAYRNYEVSATGRVYAIKPLITESDLTVGHLWDRDVPAHSYSWRSQPLTRTVNKRVDVREVTIKVQGEGTVTVTVYGLNDQTDEVEFTIDAPDRPRMYTKPVNVKSEDIEVGVVATGPGTETYTDDGVPYAIEGSPAPSVYSVSLGMRSGPSVARQGTLTRTPAA